MCTARPTEEAIEFRSNQDDAWYEVKLAVEGETLVVRYVNFPEEDNEYFRAGDFKSNYEIKALERRFRPNSQQFQDHECPIIRKNTHVCASCSFDNGDLKFFDADVVEVTNKKHGVDEDGEEQCCCIFEVLWRHGRYGGRCSSISISSLCKVLSYDKLDPALSEFLKISRQCLSVSAHRTPSPPRTPFSSSRRIQRAATPNHDSSSKKIANSRLCSSREGVPICNPSMPLEGLATCDYAPFLSESATCNPSSSLREPAIHKRVSFAKEVEVIRYVELFAATCNTNQSLNEVVVHSAGASGRIAARSTVSCPKDMAPNDNIPQSEETVLVREKSMQDKEKGVFGDECKWKIIWEEWIQEQRRKRKYICAVRTEEGRRNGLCKKNRRGKLEIRLGCSRR